MIPGIDVSHYQGLIDWRRVKAAGIRFAYIKATEGGLFVDPRLSENYSGAMDVGIPVGLYHVFKAQTGVFAANAGTAQVDNWLRARRNFPCQLPCWLDIEPGALTEETVPQAVELLKAGFTSGDAVYCSPSTGDALFAADPEAFSFYGLGLAVAHYGVLEPRLPKPWTHWLFWQHSCAGRVDGISACVDLDWFNGTEDEFQMLISPKAT